MDPKEATTEFVFRWHDDMQSHLERALENLKIDLFSEDERVANQAAETVSGILAFLHPQLTEDERRQMIIELSGSDVLSAEERRKQVGALLNPPKRMAGRPSSEAMQQAVLALTMHRSGDDWRQIAFKLRGKCNHIQHPMEKRKDCNCPACGDAVYQSVMRLKRFLKRAGLLPIELEVTPEERAWLSQNSMPSEDE